MLISKSDIFPLYIDRPVSSWFKWPAVILGPCANNGPVSEPIQRRFTTLPVSSQPFSGAPFLEDSNEGFSTAPHGTVSLLGRSAKFILTRKILGSWLSCAARVGMLMRASPLLPSVGRSFKSMLMTLVEGGVRSIEDRKKRIIRVTDEGR